MSLRTRLIAIVALVMQATTPLAAYAVAAPGPVLDDFCSVAKPVKRAPPAGPAGAPVERHGASHCAFCVGGSGVAALPAPPLAVFAVFDARSERIAHAVAVNARDAPIQPHARGPPLPA